MYIYNYFIILFSVCVSYDTKFDTIHDTKKSKIDSWYIHDLTTMHDPMSQYHLLNPAIYILNCPKRIDTKKKKKKKMLEKRT